MTPDPHPAPRLLFLILAHDRPEQAAEFARALVAAARDGRALVHFDARAPEAAVAALRTAIAGEPRVRMVERRVACPWGGFGLVEAPLNALAEVEAEIERGAPPPDHVILLSGACLPCRPVASLERFLAENPGRQFIEAEDEAWIGNGWRSERWRYRFYFNHKTQRPAEWLAFQVQRALGITRVFPEGLTPRFGSQWWALTWPVCEAMLADIRRDPSRLDFFRTVWIPDEMVFQTWVHALVPPEDIAGITLTRVQFSNRGKPVVFHDDHAGYVTGFPHFFFRKASPRAARLRDACLARAAAPDDGAPFAGLGVRQGDYKTKVAAQTKYPRPGQVFYRDQQADMLDSVLARAEAPYLVAIGPRALTRAVLDRLPAGFDPLGEAFAPDEVDLGPGREGLGGLGRGDAAIRDLHPALFLARLRARCDRVPAFAWSPLHHGPLLEAVLDDPRALKIACLPCSGDPARDRALFALAARAGGGGRAVGGGAPVPRLPAAGAALDLAARALVLGLGEAPEGWPDWLGEALIWGGGAVRSLPPHAALANLRGTTLVLPWAIGPSPCAARARAAQEAALAACRFAPHPWFADLVRALDALDAPFAATDAAALVADGPAGLAALAVRLLGPSDGAPPDAAPEDAEPALARLGARGRG